jgi:hypothetical protein
VYCKLNGVYADVLEAAVGTMGIFCFPLLVQISLFKTLLISLASFLFFFASPNPQPPTEETDAGSAQCSGQNNN